MNVLMADVVVLVKLEVRKLGHHVERDVLGREEIIKDLRCESNARVESEGARCESRREAGVAWPGEIKGGGGSGSMRQVGVTSRILSLTHIRTHTITLTPIP